MSKKHDQANPTRNPPGSQTIGFLDRGDPPPAATGEAEGSEGTLGNGKVPVEHVNRSLDDPRPSTAEELAAKEKEWRESMHRTNVFNIARRFADALLQNPKIGDYLYGSPLDPGPRGDAPNAGALLAQGVKRLAEDYLAALEALYAPAKPAPMPVPATEAGADPTDDFPLD